MSLAECTALLFQAVNENSVSLLEFAKRTYSEHQLLASLVQCNEEVKVMKNCDRTIEENQLKLSIAINQLSHPIPIVELIGYLASALQDTCLKYLNSSWLKFIAQIDQTMLFGLECWKVAMTLRYCPEDGQPLLPKIPDVSVSSEASSLIYGSAIEVMSLEELDILQENFENGVEQFSRQCIKIQALLVLRRITTQANLEYPHRLYLESLQYFADFYQCSFSPYNYKLIINVYLLLMEQLNGFDPKLLPRKSFDVFTNTICLLSLIFFEILEECGDDGPERKELNYKNLLAPTEFIILDEISPQISTQEKQKLEEYYSNFIQNFCAHRTSTVLHIIQEPPLSYSEFDINVNTIQWFLKLGADPNAVDEKGQTPLHIWARGRYFLTEEELVPMFRALVDADTHLDTANDEGETVISILKENLLSLKQSGEIAQPYFESLANTVFTLKCYCARVIRRHGIPINRLPSQLQSFVAMHSDKTD
uniref:Uncharacterized protein n=1 Tax=Daphnia galeata TaxID=27404 RepID=A0A8J2RNK1_9CRUS|nr:unnamed protein product [Daphnia galeata]